MIHRPLFLVFLAIATYFSNQSFAITNPKTPHRVLHSPSPLSPNQLKGKIVYRVHNNLWAVDPQTGTRVLMFNNLFSSRAQWYQDVAWAPQREFLTFTSFKGSIDDFTGNELFLMKWDGSGRKQLTDTKFLLYSHSPRVSPNAKQILYVRETGYRMGGPGFTGTEIRSVNLDGTNDHRIIGSISDLGTGTTEAYWSRDSKNIVFKRYLGNQDYQPDSELKIVDVAGKNEVKFDGDWRKFDVPWVSEDGNSSVTTKTDASTWALQINSSRTQEQILLVPGSQALFNVHAVISSDGHNIAFTANRTRFYSDRTGYGKFKSALGLWTAKINLAVKDPNPPIKWLDEIDNDYDLEIIEWF